MANTKITYRWNDNEETDYTITDGVYDFSDWLYDNGVYYEFDEEWNIYYVLDDNGERTGEQYSIISIEPTEEDLCW